MHWALLPGSQEVERRVGQGKNRLHWREEMNCVTYHVLSCRHEEQRQAPSWRLPWRPARRPQQNWKEETEPCAYVRVSVPRCWAFHCISVTLLPSLCSL